MKRIQFLPVLSALFAALVVSVGCGDDDGTGPQLRDLVGTWTITRLQDCNFDSGEGDFGTLTIESSGAYTITVEGQVDDRGTISISGDEMTVTSTGSAPETFSFTLSRNTLVITDNDPDCPQTVTLKRG